MNYLTDPNLDVPQRQWRALYEKYGKPLEGDHRGEFLAVSPTGRVLLAATFDEAVKKATETFGPGNFVYKVGERSVGTALARLATPDVSGE